jgi:general stress protein YciG
VKAERGRAFYEQIGKKGGDTVKAERGAQFYEQIGKKGGEAVKAERGTPFYEEIGKKGGHRVRTLIEEGKKAAIEAAAMPKPVVSDAKPAPGGEVTANEPAHE